MEYAWIASGDDEVEAALTNEALLVRPPQEQVPKAMRGTALGSVFERLVRMNDGERHAQLRRRVEERLADWDLERIRTVAASAAALVHPSDVAAYTVATMAGIEDVQRLLPFIRDFAAAVAAGAGPETVVRGIAAAQHLLEAVPPGDRDDVANTLGFLFQATAATARLIGTMLQRRTDPPVLLTRRYASRDITVCGAPIRKGDAIVVLLTNPRFYYGAGEHRCPGEDIAKAIAEAAVSNIDRSACATMPECYRT